MNQYDSFVFEKYELDAAEGTITLHYSLDGDVTFKETLIIPLQGASFVENLELDRALFALHLAGGASYFKTCCPKKIEVKSGKLTEEDAAFWNALYENGLGEFFFKNKMDYRGLINFPSSSSTPPSPRGGGGLGGRGKILIPIGGGKDSIVTIEALKKAGFDCTLLRMGHHPLIDRLAEAAGLPLITVDRHLSPKLFDLNAQGALNGHVPITAYLSFVALIVALLHEFDAVALSSERSANFGNVMYLDREINHQWSKSLEFEELFQTYLKDSIGTDISVFSFLRPLSELGIVEKFAKYPQYFSLATSCNKNWKILKDQSVGFAPGNKGGTGWCGTCPKCAFVFALYAAFIPQPTVEKIFGKNLFNDPKLEPLYRELLGLQGFKPFECVGTPDETKAAFLLAHKRGDLEDTVMMKMFIKDVLPGIKKPDHLLEEIRKPSDDHRIPTAFAHAL